MKETKLNENPDIEPLVIHSLRHTYISAANKARIPSWTLQALAGHITSRSATGDYIHVDLEELTQAAEIIVKKLLQGSTFSHSDLLKKSPSIASLKRQTLDDDNLGT